MMAKYFVYGDATSYQRFHGVFPFLKMFILSEIHGCNYLFVCSVYGNQLIDLEFKILSGLFQKLYGVLR